MCLFYNSLDTEVNNRKCRNTESFFGAWDWLFSHHASDQYPPYPDRFLKFWCRDDQAFRRACRKLWQEKRAEITSRVDDNLFTDPSIEALVDIYRMALWYGGAVVIASATGLPLDTLTFAFLIVMFFFVWATSVIAETFFNVGFQSMRRLLYRTRIMRRLRAGRPRHG